MQKKVGLLLILFGITWIIIDLFGQVSLFGNPILISNQLCYRFLGCNAGFFGYDAFDHFVSGIVEALALVYFAIKQPRLSLLARDARLSTLIILSVVICIAFSWELLEFVTDHIRIYVMHLDLFNPNRLAQPTSDDTVGDMTFAILGALAALVVLLWWRPSLLKEQN